MNLFLILMTCLMTSFSISQGLKFELSEDKPTFPAYIVLEAENLPITQGYNSVLDWKHNI